jgi:hypothetical protein
MCGHLEGAIMEDQLGPDLSHMRIVHDVLRDSYGAAPDLIRSARGDAERRELVLGYVDNVLALLLVHHEAEEELLFPVIRERAPEGLEALDRSSAQHRDLVTLLADALGAVEAWRAEGDPASAAAAEALEALDAGVRPHLAEEEAAVVPLASEHLSVAEWEGFTRYSVTHFTGDRVWLIWGLLREQMTPEQRDRMLEQMSDSARGYWESTAHQQFDELVGELRQTVPAGP